MLADAVEVLGEDREAVVCREITKRFEETMRGTLGALAAELQTKAIKGEVVVLLGRGDSENIRSVDLDSEVLKALETVSVRDAAELVAGKFGLKKRDVYQRALLLSQDREDGE